MQLSQAARKGAMELAVLELILEVDTAANLQHSQGEVRELELHSPKKIIGLAE